MNFYTKNSCQAILSRASIRPAVLDEVVFKAAFPFSTHGMEICSGKLLCVKFYFHSNLSQKFRPKRDYVCLLLLNMNMTDNTSFD